MSAYVVEPETYQKIIRSYRMIPRNFRCKTVTCDAHGIIDFESLKSFMQNVYKANVAAVTSRYQLDRKGGEYKDYLSGLFLLNIEPEELGGGVITIVSEEKPVYESIFQILKSLQCIRYQCSETLAPQDENKYRPILDELDKFIRYIEHDIVMSYPAYDRASWG